MAEDFHSKVETADFWPHSFHATPIASIWKSQNPLTARCPRDLHVPPPMTCWSQVELDKHAWLPWYYFSMAIPALGWGLFRILHLHWRGMSATSYLVERIFVKYFVLRGQNERMYWNIWKFIYINLYLNMHKKCSERVKYLLMMASFWRVCFQIKHD